MPTPADPKADPPEDDSEGLASPSPAASRPTSNRGPYIVGVREIEVDAKRSPEQETAPLRRLPTSVWYPAALRTDEPPSRERAGSDTLLVEDAPHELGQPHQAAPEASPDPSPWPLILFSHGNSGLRHQSTFLMTHLASWGFVVAAPDHVGNTFLDSAERTDPNEIRTAHHFARKTRPFDVLAVLDHLLGQDDDRLPTIDPARLGALGHSFGGWTTLKLAQHEKRLRALCCLAPVAEPFVGRRAFDANELPLPSALRTLVLAAAEDVLVDLDTSIRPLFDRLGPGARLEILEGLDHFHFCDGIELLHKMHFNAPRPGQTRATLPYAKLRDEAATHALLNQRVAAFFAERLQ